MLDYISIIKEYYSEDSELYNLLIKHSRQVAEFAMEIVIRKGLIVNNDFVYEASMLHDIGIFKTNAPSIFCYGTEPYLRHGIIGASILREKGLFAHASVCKTHIGTGLTSQEIIEQNLPLPKKDFLPNSIEEKLVCYSDNFFSKSNPERVKTVDELRLQLKRYGSGTTSRFEEMLKLFGA